VARPRRALNSPWTDEIPTYLPTAQVRAFLSSGLAEDPNSLIAWCGLGLIKQRATSAW